MTSVCLRWTILFLASSLAGCAARTDHDAAVAAARPEATTTATPAAPQPGESFSDTTYATMKREVRVFDPVAGVERTVLGGVELRAATTAKSAMMTSTVLWHSYIPETIARTLGAADLGEVELAPIAQSGSGEIDEPAHLAAVYGLNKTQQRRFRKVRIDRVDLGVGPAFGPVEALVFSDANATIGVIGRQWLSHREGRKGFILAATDTVHFGELKIAP